MPAARKAWVMEQSLFVKVRGDSDEARSARYSAMTSGDGTVIREGKPCCRTQISTSCHEDRIDFRVDSALLAWARFLALAISSSSPAVCGTSENSELYMWTPIGVRGVRNGSASASSLQGPPHPAFILCRARTGSRPEPRLQRLRRRPMLRQCLRTIVLASGSDAGSSPAV